MKFNVFPMHYGKVVKWKWILIHEVAHVAGGQHVIAESPARNYASLEECKADIALLCRRLSKSTPIVVFGEGD